MYCCLYVERFFFCYGVFKKIKFFLFDGMIDNVVVLELLVIIVLVLLM